MSNPVLVEVTRGGRVESRHRGAAVVIDSDGGILFEVGDIDAPVFPRSAVKAMQALPLVESGAADAYGFGNRELALACASHSGEPAHAELARAMLAAAGRSEATLECGCQWPMDRSAALDLAKSGAEPSQLHNNCSGKHAGFICAACHLGIDPEGYVNYGHAIQGMIRDTMADLTGQHYAVDNCGTDGCSIPTYAVPLRATARGFAKLASGHGLAPARARAGKRLVEACMAEPFYVAGTERACTRLMSFMPGSIFAKTGAEGVFCAALPDQGVAMAVKCDDGARRAVDAVVTALLARYLEDTPEVKEALHKLAGKILKNWKGVQVGTVRVTDALS